MGEQTPDTSGEPTCAAEHAALFFLNHRITGYGEAVTTHHPCPWCAAPDFMVARVADEAAVMRREHTCAICGRSGTWVFSDPGDDPPNWPVRLVQIGGADPPDWLNPAPWRVAIDPTDERPTAA